MTVLISPAQRRYQWVRSLSRAASQRTMLALDLQRSPAPFCVIHQSCQSDPDQFHALTQVLQRLSDQPSIPALVEAFQREQEGYWVYDYVAGPSLADVLNQQGAFSPAQVRRVLVETLTVLQRVHRDCLVHGDLSLTSWRYQETAFKSLLMLVGWGSVGWSGSPAPAGADPVYAAPEQLQGRVSSASDIYSLGLICLHLLSGVETFEGVAQPSIEVSDRPLGHILAGMMEPDETKRFASATAVLEAMGLRGLARRSAGGAVSVVPDAALTKQLALPDNPQRKIKGVAIAAPANAEYVVSGYHDGTLAVWELPTGQPVSQLQHPAAALMAVAVSGVGPWLASGDQEGTVCLWDWPSQQLKQPCLNLGAAVTALAWHPQQWGWASGHSDGCCWLHQDEGSPAIALAGHRAGITALDYHPQGTLLATASLDRTVRLWQVSTGKLMGILGRHTKAVKAIAFSPDGTLLATGGDDNQIMLWQVENHELVRLIPGHRWTVSALAFSANGDICISGSWDGQIKQWDVATGQALGDLTAHPDMILAIGQMRSGARVSISRKGILRISPI